MPRIRYSDRYGQTLELYRDCPEMTAGLRPNVTPGAVWIAITFKRAAADQQIHQRIIQQAIEASIIAGKPIKTHLKSQRKSYD
jgi:hypothetical protein